MNKYNPLLVTDFYKTTHHEQYPSGLTKMVSYFTPRMSRIQEEDKLIMFGLQGFCQEFLMEAFNNNFFKQPREKVLKQYKRRLDNSLGEGAYDLKKIADLYDLGYLPLAIRAIPEGSRVDMKVPMIEITNTHPNFVWLVNTIETPMCAYLWHAMVSANVGYRYRQIVNKYYDMTVEDNVPRARALGDFSMRGQESIESAILSSAGWLLSFLNTATVPAIDWLEDYYECNSDYEDVGFGAISTEHSVMCSNAAIDGDEITHVRRLLNEIYPNLSFSMVSDSYDYWNMIDVIIPAVKQDILNHNGCFLVRGDSGDPVEIIAGKEIHYIENEDEFCSLMNESNEFIRDYFDSSIEADCEILFHYNGIYYKAKVVCEWTNERGAWTDQKYYYIEGYEVEVAEYTLTSQDKGTVWRLWEIIGGTINSKGFKVLDSHIRAIYGDSITPQRCAQIYYRLMQNGFACNCAVLGVGSFSMQCLEVDDKLSPFTRDTYSIAVKATYAEDENGEPVMIFKNPKTDTGNFKKSQKGCCAVLKDEDGNFSYVDEMTYEQARSYPDNCYEYVFINGTVYNESLGTIRNRLQEGQF